MPLRFHPTRVVSVNGGWPARGVSGTVDASEDCMRPILPDELVTLAPGADRRLAAEHVSRLDSRYFERFDAAEVARHVGAISSLGPALPAAVLVDGEPSAVQVTVLAFDHPGAFSAITGVLSSMGFNIVRGDIFTWSRPASDSPRELE